MSADKEPSSSRKVEDLLRPHRKLLARLRRPDLSKGDLDDALRAITELASEVLDVERTSVWRLAKDGARLDCMDLFVRGTSMHRAEAAITMDAVPAYADALRTERCVAAHDAVRDPRTAEFRDSYLEPNRIGAMLDSPVFVHGEMAGVLCHEHVGGERTWSLWEELVASTLADFVSYVLEAEERAAELRSSEENFRRLFEVAPSPMVLARAGDGTIDVMNRRAREVIRVPEGVDVNGLPASRFYESEIDRAHLLEDVRTFGHVDEREIVMKTWDGDLRWCLLSARAMTFRGEPHVAAGFIDVTPMKELERRLRDAAMRDPLTGVFNRRHFYEVGRGELERARRYDRPVSLAMLDADHFKAKNDRFGHGVGDEILVWLAKRAGAGLRQSDVLARWGGEEFVILFTETDLEEAALVTERLRAAIASTPAETAAGPVGVTISAGVVGWARGDESLEGLVARADQAMYQAKQGGRDCVVRG